MRPLHLPPALSKPLSNDSKRRSRKNVVVAAFILILAAGIVLLFLPSLHIIHNNEEITAPDPRLTPKISSMNDLIVPMEVKEWVGLIVKPLVFEVGGLVLFQVIGMPLLSEVLWVTRRIRFIPVIQSFQRLRWLPFIQQACWRTRLVGRRRSGITHFVNALPKTIRNIPRSVVKLYKRRSRLAIASEYTNFIVNEEELYSPSPMIDRETEVHEFALSLPVPRYSANRT